ncbi:MAG TPA: TetR/AcrR family transcriptional regulator [Jiangellaceae bacterium]|nr:TetR/AcrR family transcriptional regulator [Jiangellaceae bacterium]
MARGNEPGAVGPRPPRRQATTEALHRAVQELLEEVGYRALTIEGVALKARVAKTSIYRRWPSKAEMVFDLMLHSSAELPAMDDKGSLTGDIEALSARVVALVAGPLGRSIFPGLIADITADVALMQRFRATFVTDGRDQIARVLERSVRRGDLADASAAADLQAALIGAAIMLPLLYSELSEGALQEKITALAMAVVDQHRPDARVGRSAFPHHDR